MAADWMLLPTGELARNHTVITDNEGVVLEVVPGILSEAEFYKGILCPGFINAHGHLELSYMRGMIQPNRTLVGFIEEMISTRQKEADATKIIEKAFDADNEMWKAGIQAAGDICNTAHTVAVKSKSNIRYHNFIELFNLDPALAEKTFHYGEELLGKFESFGLSGSITPHAPYSLSKKLFQLIRDHSNVHNSLWSIHHQEAADENSNSGSVLHFFKSKGLLPVEFENAEKSSTEFIHSFFPKSQKLLLVHNTFTDSNDIDFLKSSGDILRTFFCLCPNANLYIENRLPNIVLLMNSGVKMVIGTDSLASNRSLSIFNEIKTIHTHYPHIPICELLTWATANGADYFGWNDLGRFVPGANPGILHISNADEKHFGKDSELKRIY